MQLPPPPTPPSPRLRFGPFVLDIPNASLSEDGRPVGITPKSFELLVCLIRRPGQLVLKDELLDDVWGGRPISEGVVKTVVSELRSALKDDARTPRWVETVPRRGYRFVGEVHTHEAPLSSPAAPVTSPSLRSSAPAASGTPPVGNLPLPATALLGREAERDQAMALLAAHRLVTLVGPGGIGKTRLAVDCAHQVAMPDGTWFVALAPLAAETTDAGTLRSLLSQVMALPSPAPTSDEALAQALGPQQVLLLLDNAEHVLDTLAPLLEFLLSRASGLRLLVTSQEPLRIDGEQLLRLQALGLPEPDEGDDTANLMRHGAIQLFVERVAARLPGFTLTPHHRAAVATICRALDGLPLALELAASRVPLLGVHGLLDRLTAEDEAAPEQRFRLLNAGSRTASPRQRTLQDALAWSHGLLTPLQQRVLRRLAVFRGGFTLEAAQHVCADAELDAWGVLDGLDALVEKSLLLVQPAEDGRPRYQQLESVRAFSLQRLQEAEELSASRDRHLQASLVYWESADTAAHGERIQTWIACHSPELDNLRTALHWAAADVARADAALGLVGHGALLWSRVGLAQEGQRWCETVRSRAQTTLDEGLRARFDLAVAYLAQYGNVYSPVEGLDAAERATAAARTHGALDPVRHYIATYLVYFLGLRARPAMARQALLDTMRRLVQPSWSEILTRNLRFAEAYELRLQGRFQEYLAVCREELARYRRLDAATEAWAAAWGLMLAEYDNGRAREALAIGRDALDEIRRAGRLRQHLVFLAFWIILLAESGDVPATRTALKEASPLMRAAGAPWMAQLAFSWLAAHEGRNADAARLLGWYHADGQARGESSTETLQRSAESLRARIEARIGIAAFESHRAAGATLDNEAATHLALRESETAQT